MQLNEFLKTLPLPVVMISAAVFIMLTIFMAVHYAREKGLAGIQNEVYRLILKAEHRYKESGKGQQKLRWVVQQARELLPKWMQIFVSEQMLIQVIDHWFQGIKDLLEDGKAN